MSSSAYQIGGDDFNLDKYRHQEVWSWLIALAFFFGDVGAGLFLFSAFYSVHLSMIIGWVMVTVLKPIALFLHLGKATRFWRAALNPKKSWISRGLIGSIIFSGFGAIHIANSYYAIFPEFLSSVIFWIAILSSLVVIIYLGFVLSHSPSIRLWNSGLMPIMILNYGLLGGATLLILFGSTNLASHAIETLEIIELVLVLFGIVLLISFLHGAAYSSRAGKYSVWLLLKDHYSVWFIGVVVVIGLLLIALLMVLSMTYDSLALSLLLTIAVAELVGDLGFKMMLFRAGTYEPTMRT